MFSDYLDTIAFVSKYDPQVGEAMQAELKRQRRNLIGNFFKTLGAKIKALFTKKK